MKLFAIVVLWALLLVACWPLALAVLILWPLVWIVSIPFRVAGIVIHISFALVTTLLLLPARLLGHRGR